MRFRKFILPISIVIFLGLTLAGTYYVRLRILEKRMVIAMDREDNVAVAELANSFPCLVNARDKYGRTPLHRAVEWRDRGLIESLLRKGADVNAKDNSRLTPLHWATSLWLVKAGELFIGKRPDDKVDSNGRTSRCWGADDRQIELVGILIAEGADVNARSKGGRTPLHWAASREVAERLIAKGADINARDAGGRTPLHNAAANGWKDVAEILIRKGADINAEDNAGKTALRWAILERYDAVAEVLRKAGAKE